MRSTCRLTLWDEDVDLPEEMNIEIGTQLKLTDCYTGATDFGLDITKGKSADQIENSKAYALHLIFLPPLFSNISRTMRHHEMRKWRGASFIVYGPFLIPMRITAAVAMNKTATMPTAIQMR